MKVAVPAQGQTPEAAVDERFGRAPYFVLTDLSSRKHEAVENTGAGAAHGAGTRAAQILGSHNVDIVLVADIGPNPLTALLAAGIRVFRGIKGRVNDAVVDYEAGHLTEIFAPTVASHTGLGRPPGS